MPGDIDDKFYLGTVSWMTLDEIANTWEEGHKVQNVSKIGPIQDAMEAMHKTGVRKRDVREHLDGSPVITIRFKPQRAAEDGRVVTVALGGNVVLEDDKWPAWAAKMSGYPGAQFTWFKHPLQFRPPSPIEDQVPIQREINITRSQIIENKNALSALKILNPTGSGVRKITDMAGQIINYNAGLEPKYMQPPSIPAYVFRHWDEVIASLEDVQMRHQASRGKVPPGVKSGIGILNLAEQDDRPLSVPEIEEHEQLSLLFRKILHIISVAVSEERMLRFVGRNKRRHVRAFKGADLRDNDDIHVGVVGGGTKTKSGVQAFYLEMLKAGLFRDEQGNVDQKKFIDAMRYSIPDTLYEETDRDEELARDMVDMLEDIAQPAPIPQEWDDHRKLLEVVEDVMKDMSWRRRAQEDPELFTRFVVFRRQLLLRMSGQPLEEQGVGGVPGAPPPGGAGALPPPGHPQGQGPIITEGV